MSAPKQAAKGALAVVLLDAGLKLAALGVAAYAATKAVKALAAAHSKKK